MSTQTPGPWKITEIPATHPDAGNYWIEASQPQNTFDSCTALATVYDAPNATFIVRACNSHEAMVTKLREAMEKLDRQTMNESYGPEWWNEALSLAEGTVNK